MSSDKKVEKLTLFSPGVIDQIKAGRKWRFIGDGDYTWRKGDCCLSNTNLYSLFDSVIEFQPREVTITREMLGKAWDNAWKDTSLSHHKSIVFDGVCKELGL